MKFGVERDVVTLPLHLTRTSQEGSTDVKKPKHFESPTSQLKSIYLIKSDQDKIISYLVSSIIGDTSRKKLFINHDRRSLL